MDEVSDFTMSDKAALGDSSAAFEVVSALRTADQIAEAFAALSREEEVVNAELEELLAHHVKLEHRLRGLASATPQMMHSVSGDATKLAKVIDFTAKLAEGVAVKVKQLDLAKVSERFELFGHFNVIVCLYSC